MKKFAANFLVSQDGSFLKNGIVEADEAGKVIRVVDTKGDLREAAQLTFHNGILIAGFVFVKDSDIMIPVQAEFHSFAYQLFSHLEQINLQNLVEAGTQIQVQFPEMNIPEILNEISDFLVESGSYRKETIPGIFLLVGADLFQLRFTSQCRLKKIL